MHPATGHFARTLRVVWQVIRHPVLRRVELAFLVFNAAESGTWIAVLLYDYQATGPALVELVAAAQLLPAGMSAPVAATLGDRYPRVWVLFAGHLLLGLALILTGVAMLHGGPPLRAILRLLKAALING